MGHTHTGTRLSRSGISGLSTLGGGSFAFQGAPHGFRPSTSNAPTPYGVGLDSHSRGNTGWHRRGDSGVPFGASLRGGTTLATGSRLGGVPEGDESCPTPTAAHHKPVASRPRRGSADTVQTVQTVDSTSGATRGKWGVLPTMKKHATRLQQRVEAGATAKAVRARRRSYPWGPAPPLPSPGAMVRPPWPGVDPSTNQGMAGTAGLDGISGFTVASTALQWAHRHAAAAATTSTTPVGAPRRSPGLEMLRAGTRIIDSSRLLPSLGGPTATATGTSARDTEPPLRAALDLLSAPCKDNDACQAATLDNGNSGASGRESSESAPTDTATECQDKQTKEPATLSRKHTQQDGCLLARALPNTRHSCGMCSSDELEGAAGGEEGSGSSPGESGNESTISQRLDEAGSAQQRSQRGQLPIMPDACGGCPHVPPRDHDLGRHGAKAPSHPLAASASLLDCKPGAADSPCDEGTEGHPLIGDDVGPKWQRPWAIGHTGSSIMSMGAKVLMRAGSSFRSVLQRSVGGASRQSTDSLGEYARASTGSHSTVEVVEHGNGMQLGLHHTQAGASLSDTRGAEVPRVVVAVENSEQPCRQPAWGGKLKRFCQRLRHCLRCGRTPDAISTALERRQRQTRELQRRQVDSARARLRQQGHRCIAAFAPACCVTALGRRKKPGTSKRARKSTHTKPVDSHVRSLRIRILVAVSVMCAMQVGSFSIKFVFEQHSTSKLPQINDSGARKHAGRVACNHSG